MSLLRTMTPKGGVLGTVGTSAFIVLVVNSAVTAYYSPYVSPYSPYSTSQRSKLPIQIVLFCSDWCNIFDFDKHLNSDEYLL